MSYRERAETIIQEPLCINIHERLMNLLDEADRELAQAQAEIRELKEVVIPNGRELLKIQMGYTEEAQAERDLVVAEIKELNRMLELSLRKDNL